MPDMETRVSLLEQGYEWVREALEAAKTERDGLSSEFGKLRDAVRDMLQHDEDRSRDDKRKQRRMEQRIQVMTLVLLILSLVVAVTGILLTTRP